MKFKSALLTSASGSVGGATWSRNKGGMYIRARAIPTNPSSTYQQTVRSAMAQLVTLWGSVLTAAQRAAWDVYADNTPLIDPLGSPTLVSGLNMYVRGNVLRLQTALVRADDAPTTYDLGGYTEPSVTASEATQQVSVAFDNTDAWANEDEAAMFCSVSRPFGAGINYFTGPYRLAGLVEGDSTTPPTSPATIAVPFAFVAGQKLGVRCVVSRADGRRSADFRDVIVAAA